MHASTRAILSILKSSRRGVDLDAVAALREDLRGLTDAQLARVWTETPPKRTPPARGPAKAHADAYAAATRARRQLLMPAPKFAKLLIARVAKEAKFDAGAVTAAARKSLKRTVEECIARADADTVAGAARAIARERSLAYDIA